MKGVIIIPTFYAKRHKKGKRSRISKYLFHRLRAIYKLPLLYSDDPKLSNWDVALSYAVPYHNRPQLPQSFLKANNTKLISYFGDLPCWYNKTCERNKRRMFNRADVVMGGYHEKFLKWFPEYVDKYEFFPAFFFPYERYACLEPNLKPIMKCLLIGSVRKHYPFRYLIKGMYKRNTGGLKMLMDVVKGSIKVSAGKYPAFLNSYFCAIATSGTNSCIVAKYFEIPASGTLLVGERKPELDLLGFKPYVHYVPITPKNVIEQIKKVLYHPKEYFEIREKGMRFVRRNHSDINRVIQFRRVLDRALGIDECES